MKRAMQALLKKTNIIKWLGKAFSYFLKSAVEDNPRYLSNLQYECNRIVNRKLLEKIQTKGSLININGGITITHPRSIVLGNNVHIGENCYFFSRAGLSIGDNTHLSRNITIYTSSHDYESSVLPYSSDHIDKPVSIGSNVWIGMNVNILPGVTIGEGAIISMGSTISKDVAPFEIVGSNPQTVLKRRNIQLYKAAQENNSIGGANGVKLNEKQKELFKISTAQLKTSPFFVLSTGRAGSTTIAKLLSQHPDVKCLHEPKYALIRLSTEYLHGLKSEAETLAELRMLFIDSNILEANLIYGESDQKLSNMAHLIKKILPEAKFIWLIRNPKDTVNSTCSRGWFSDYELGFTDNEKLDNKLYRHIFSDYRPQADLANNLSAEEWKLMSQFERNCWYWSYWNSTIEEQLKDMPISDWMKVKLEEIDYKTAEILAFIGARPFRLKPTRTNTAETKYTLSTTNDWTTEDHLAFDKWCKESHLY